MGKTQNLSIQNCLLGVKCWNLKTMKINRFSILLKEGVPLHAYIKVPLHFSPFLCVLGVVVFQYHVFCQVTVISLKIWKKNLHMHSFICSNMRRNNGDRSKVVFSYFTIKLYFIASQQNDSNKFLWHIFQKVQISNRKLFLHHLFFWDLFYYQYHARCISGTPFYIGKSGAYMEVQFYLIFNNI